MKIPEKKEERERKNKAKNGHLQNLAMNNG